MTPRWRLTLALLCACAAASRAAAQTPARDDRRSEARFDVGVGAIWIGATSFGTRDATETAPGGSRFVLFSTSDRLGAAAGAEARVGVHLSRTLEVDVTASYAAPALRTTITFDVESAAPVTAIVGVRQLTIGGSLVVHLTRVRIGSRGTPFVEAGAGYLRQLYETLTLAPTGQIYHVGGGATWMLVPRTSRRATGVGLRADVRALVRTKGVAVDGRAHVAPAAGASLFVRF